MYIEQSLSRFNDPLAAAHKEDERKRRGIKATPNISDDPKTPEEALRRQMQKKQAQEAAGDMYFDKVFGEGLRNAQAAERRKSAWMDFENSKRNPIKENKEKIETKRKQLEEEKNVAFDRQLKNMAIMADINKTNRS
jgi:hypothetical protein